MNMKNGGGEGHILNPVRKSWLLIINKNPPIPHTWTPLHFRLIQRPNPLRSPNRHIGKPPPRTNPNLLTHIIQSVNRAPQITSRNHQRLVHSRDGVRDDDRDEGFPPPKDGSWVQSAGGDKLVYDGGFANCASDDDRL
jgi:hypothetical protein